MTSLDPWRRRLQMWAAGQLGTALLLLARPEQAVALIGADETSAPSTWIVRLLGLRLFAQATVQLFRPNSTTALAGAAVDTAHAASMVAVAVTSARYRRAALLSGGAAAGSAAVLITMADRVALEASSR
jgi:hypothetical protein